LHGGIHRRHATTDHDDAAADRDCGVVARLAQAGNELDGISQTQWRNADARFVAEPECVDTTEAQADEHRIEVMHQLRQLNLLADRVAVAHLDAADREQPRDLLLCEVIDGLVGREAVLVQAAGFGFGLEHRDLVAKHRGAVRARKARRPGADDGDAAAGGRVAREQRRAVRGEIVIGRMALQEADLDRLVFVRVAHAGLLAQHLGRAHTCAHAAEDVGLEDRLGRAAQVVLADAADERRDVDAGRAGVDARCVVAVVAALGLDQRLHGRQRWVGVGEVVGVLAGREASGFDVGLGHRPLPLRPRARRPAAHAARPAASTHRTSARMPAG
jgi:hypothetical protein